MGGRGVSATSKEASEVFGKRGKILSESTRDILADKMNLRIDGKGDSGSWIESDAGFESEPEHRALIVVDIVGAVGK